MNFKAYDILSSLIPGFLLLLVLLNFLDMKYDKDLSIAYTAVAFFFGYFLNTVGSWLEDFYHLTWGGNPSDNLLDGKNIWKVSLYDSKAIKDDLKKKTSNLEASNAELFAIARRNAIGEKDTRIEDFNSLYAFSRTLLTTGLLGGILLIIQHHDNWKYYTAIIPVLIILWLRCKQRAYYFAKEILDVYSKKSITR